MKLILLCLIVILSGCASTSKVDEVEQQILAGQETISQLDEKISQLEQDKQALQKQLQFMDGESQSQAVGIREKIALIDQSIDNYKSEIAVITDSLAKQGRQITGVQNQQDKQKAALAEAIRKNQALKEQAAEEIRALEEAYDEKRNKQENPDDPNQED